jgi:hypothetical protein
VTFHGPQNRCPFLYPEALKTEGSHCIEFDPVAQLELFVAI